MNLFSFSTRCLEVSLLTCLLAGSREARAALNLISLFPANGATNVCTDTPLRMTFDSAPRWGQAFTNTEQISIYNQAGTLVDCLSMTNNVLKTGSTNVQSRFIAATNGSTYSYYTFPYVVSNNTVTLFPHNIAFTTNQTYYINITSRLFTNSANGAFGGISDSSTWRFSTKASLPSRSTNQLEVAADGTKDFCTVQGALDFLPASTGQHILINLHKGFYQELVWVNSKTNITLRGEDRQRTIIGYANNDNLNSGSTKRCLVQVTGDDFALENLTLTNTTAYGGSQAEALRINSRRFIGNNCDFGSFQDTLLINSSSHYAYLYNCLIEGSVDFTWGDGCLVYQNCEIRSTVNGGYDCQMRTPDAAHYGAIFLDCSLSKLPGVTSAVLNRIDPNAYPYAAVAFVNCLMDTHITSAGWELDNYTNGVSPTNNLRLWEYASLNITGTAPVDVSHRLGASQQLSAAQASALRNLTNVYGPNLQWLPQLAPNILAHPTNQTVATGATVSFVASATGIQTANPLHAGEPSVLVPLSYQWLKNGTNLSGATNATLTLSNVTHLNAGGYVLVVRNWAGIALSSNASLTFSDNHPPVAATATGVRHSGLPLQIALSDLATNWSDPDSDPVSLVSVVASCTNGGTAACDGAGTITYTNAHNVSDQIAYTIQDVCGATASGVVNVQVAMNPPSSFESVVANGNQSLTLRGDGTAGVTYWILSSTNLALPLPDWTILDTNTAGPDGRWQFVEPSDPYAPCRFYRAVEAY